MRSSRHVPDESGAALALAVMVVVVAGVMGAGLLVFVRGDILAAAQANQGQRAFYVADAGTKAAARQLLSDARPESYDDTASDACNHPADEDSKTSSDWSGGKTQNISGGKFVTSIRYVTTDCAAPGTGMETGKTYFEVVSTGTYEDAKRRIEAVYSTSDIGSPLAVFAAGDVTLGSTAKLSGGSVFSGDDLTIETGAEIVAGDDGAYGDWQRPGYNETSRGTEAAGIGAVKTITGETTAPVYDSISDPRFVVSDPATGQLTYPFDPSYWSDDSRRDFMREEATLLVKTSGSLDWPSNSTRNTVVYVDLSESPGDVEIMSSECGGTVGCRGTLIVEGGGVNVGSGADFGGNIVTFGDGGDDLNISLDENSELKGTVASGGDLIVAGKVSVAGPDSYLAPGMHGVHLESWRELYE